MGMPLSGFHGCLGVAVSGCGYDCNEGHLRNFHDNKSSVCRILLSHHLNQSTVTKWSLREVLLPMQ